MGSGSRCDRLNALLLYPMIDQIMAISYWREPIWFTPP